MLTMSLDWIVSGYILWGLFLAALAVAYAAVIYIDYRNRRVRR